MQGEQTALLRGLPVSGRVLDVVQRQAIAMASAMRFIACLLIRQGGIW